MRINSVSIQNVISDFAEDNGLDHDELESIPLTRWGTDALNMMNLVEQLRNKVVLLRVENGKAVLPHDFKTLLQLAANVRCERPFVKTRREEVSQWVMGTYESDCHLEINLKCDKCHKDTKTCGCGEHAVHKPFEVDVDRIWEAAHPEYYYKGYKRIGRFGYGPQPGSSYSPRFELMRVATQDFHRANLIIGDCPNIGCQDCVHTFRVDPPVIEVDFEDGEVLLSYLGRPIDEKGDSLIPDHPDILEAIQNHLEYKWYGRAWKRSSQQADKLKMDQAYQLREINMGIAKSVAEMPEFTEVKVWIDTQFYKRLPDMNFNWNVNKKTVDKYELYNRRTKY